MSGLRQLQQDVEDDEEAEMRRMEGQAALVRLLNARLYYGHFFCLQVGALVRTQR